MNNYYVVATAKHTLNLRGKQYKIGEAIPTELTEKEYEFYKDALNVESVTKTDKPCFSPKKDNENLEVENLLAQLEAAKRRIEELELNAQTDLVISEKNINNTETEIKPKRPYAKKETK